MESNEVLDKLPRHLMGLIIDQPYFSYTALDHAIWRYVMRRNIKHLSKVAHGSYLEGLRRTGISIDAIPHMYGMNRILREIGWAAVAVDGFIPPSAFMEFQAYKVLVIAADIRPLDQIEYTPAPDIIHEAAGHAPIIADPEYADYLRFFGEIGSKAFSSARDYELYEAIRHLSILKADPYTPKSDIDEAEIRLAELDRNMGQPSEMAMIRNLHWWTVEYGLIGNLDNFKIYGAGLLSSISESMNCMKPVVKKLPYSIDAVNYGFDITTQQPQLFVTPDFKHLNSVLNEFANKMALREGGSIAVHRAEGSGNTATVELSSGLQISGTFKDCIYNDRDVIYLKTVGPTSLCAGNRELPMHSKRFHAHGFGSPVGRLQAGGFSLQTMSEGELDDAGFQPGVRQQLVFESGVQVSGIFDYVRTHKGKNILFSFTDCTVTYKGEILFRPDWGKYDMAVGEEVVSAYQGPADADAFGFNFEAPAERTHKIVYNAADLKRHRMYQQLRDARSGKAELSDTEGFFRQIIAEFPMEWLLLLELHDFLKSRKDDTGLIKKVATQLESIRASSPGLSSVVSDGLVLCGNNN
ncbi:MAG: phenylalanine 4-monooxygenase [Bacteroidetes bacterium HGW-Bacteroidetes-9]|jgi:phenylalanine-4-hydroxylase|nr:MAG: phenylalanine 4-monooxygenase [Bacteroidetes bacterium HGW-Bacteroidetes-9]